MHSRCNGALFESAAISAPVSLLGSILGARLNLWIPERYLQIMMMVLLPIAAATLLLNRDFGLENRSDCLLYTSPSPRD